MAALLSMIPSALLYLFICLYGKAKKDSCRFLLKLIGLGGLSALAAAAIDIFFDDVIFSSFDHESIIYMIFSNFILVALVEEGSKFFVLNKKTRKDDGFTYTFKGLIYAASVAFGFAVVENIVYLMFDVTVTKIIVRGLLGGFGHVIDSIFMGIFYGNAKYLEATGDEVGCRKELIKALLIPVIIHGTFDFLILQAENTVFLLLFLAFYIAEIIVAFKFLKRAHHENRDIPEPGLAPEPDPVR